MQLVPSTQLNNTRKRSSRSSFSSRPRTSIMMDPVDYIPSHRPSETYPALVSRNSQDQKTPMRSAVESVSFIADHFRKEEEDQQVVNHLR